MKGIEKMRKLLDLPISVTDYGDQKAVSIDIGRNSISEWCLALCLLERNLVRLLTVTSRSELFKLTILKKSQLPNSVRGRVKWQLNEAEVQVSQTELEMWLDFFLKYYRDGIADVDHIDVDIPVQEDAKGLFITFSVTDFMPPVSSEEARRRLGL